jgi:hypothetical protein
MNSCRGTVKLGTMKNKNDEKENVLATDTDGGFYKILVKGHLDNSWSDWLGDLEIELVNDGGMILTGYIEDQAALMGILNKLYNLNLAILTLSKTSHKK